MGDNYKKDGLEDFFRKRLEGFEEVPREDMWHKIAFEIPPKPAVVWWKKPFWWMSGSVLIGLGIFFWQWNVQITKYKSIIETQHKTITALQKSSTTTKRLDPVEVDDLAALKNKQESDETIAQLGGLPEKETFTKEGRTPPLKKADGNTRKLDSPPFNIEKELPKDESFDPVMAQKKASEKNTDLLEKTGLGKIDSLDEHRKSYVVARTVKKLPAAGKKQLAGSQIIPVSVQTSLKYRPSHEKRLGFYFSLQARDLVTLFERSFIRNASFATGEAFGYQVFASPRLQLGILAGLQLNRKWSVAIGLGLKRTHINFSDLKEFVYTDEVFNTLNSQGDPMGVYDACSCTPSPTIAYQFVNHLGNDGNDIGEGDAFEVNAYYNYFMEYVSIPLWVRYRIGNRRLHGFARTGISWNILTSSSYGWNQASISFDRIMLQQAEFVDGGLSNTYLELGLGGGLEYDINIHHSIGLEASFYRSLSTVLGGQQSAMGVGLEYKYIF